LRAVESGIVPAGSFLLIESLDRLSRDTLSEQMTLFMTLINSGITVVTLADNQSYSKATINSDLSRLMMSLVIMMRAHQESLTKSHRLKAVWKAKRERIGKEKLTAQCPAWLRLGEDRQSFTVIEERAAVVGRISQLNNDGMGHHSIAQLLNTERIISWGKRKNGWHDSYVLYILRTKAVLGEFLPHRRERGEHRRAIPIGDPILDYYPPVIDLATWQRAQSRRQTSTPGRVGERVANLFSGIIWDGYNGTSMRFMSRRPRPDSNGLRQGKWHYLVSDYGRLLKGAKTCSWRYPWFETWFLNYIVGQRQTLIPRSWTGALVLRKCSKMMRKKVSSRFNS
jgi:DNA invertase Pin-like site-specific DNA recombinase